MQVEHDSDPVLQALAYAAEAHTRQRAALSEYAKLQEQQDARGWSPKELAQLEVNLRQWLRQCAATRHRTVLYGSHAINHYLPEWLQGVPGDFDVYIECEIDAFELLITQALAFLRGHYPTRSVALRTSLHNPQFSRGITISRRPVLDLTRCEAPLADAVPCDDNLRVVSFAWLTHNLRAILRNEHAAYRHKSDALRLGKLAVAQHLGVLRNTEERMPPDELQESLARIDFTDARLVELQESFARIDFTDARLAELTAQLEQEKRSRIAAAERTAELEAQLETAQQSALAAQEKSVKEFRRSTAALETQMRAKDEKISAQARRLRQLEERVAQLERSKQQEDTLMRNLRRIEEDNAKQALKLVELGNECAKLERQVQQRDKYMTTFVGRLSEQTRKTDTIRDEYSALHEQYTAKTIECARKQYALQAYERRRAESSGANEEAASFGIKGTLCAECAREQRESGLVLRWKFAARKDDASPVPPQILVPLRKSDDGSDALCSACLAVAYFDPHCTNT